MSAIKHTHTKSEEEENSNRICEEIIRAIMFCFTHTHSKLLSDGEWQKNEQTINNAPHANII